MRPIFAAAFLASSLTISSASGAPITQTITYQGELSEGGVPKTGTIDVRVKIFDAAQAGAQFEASLGAVCFPQSAARENLESAIAQADAALYRAKREGRDRGVVICSSGRHDAIARDGIAQS